MCSLVLLGKRWSLLPRRNLRTSIWVWLHWAGTPTFSRVGPGAELPVSWDSMLPRVSHQDYLLSADKSLYSLSSHIFSFMELHFLNSSKLQTSTKLSILRENLTGSHCLLSLDYPAMKLLKLCTSPFYFSPPLDLFCQLPHLSPPFPLFTVGTQFWCL